MVNMRLKSNKLQQFKTPALSRKRAREASGRKDRFLKSVIEGTKHVIYVAWTVPAVRSYTATLLVRFGLPTSLVALGIAVGEKLVL